jgi:DNA-binding CsgD family transcriptional regulator
VGVSRWALATLLRCEVSDVEEQQQREVGRQAAARSVTAAVAATLIDREAVAGQLDDVLARARGRSIAGLAVVGGAGTGKTELAELTAAAAGPDVRVVFARGQAAEAEQPFSYADQLFLLWGWPSVVASRAAARTAGSVADLHDDPMLVRSALFGQARAVLRRWTADGPVLLVLDDLHWADPDSLALLQAVLTHSSHQPVAVVAMLRPWPETATSMVRAVQASLGSRVLAVASLENLDADGATALLTRRLGVPPDPQTAAAVWRVARGNPLLTIELADGIGAGERVGGEASSAGWRELGPDSSILLARHLVGLPGDAVAVARAAAVVGLAGGLEAVRAVAEVDVDRFAAAIDVLVASGTLRRIAGGSVRFVHDLLPEAVTADLSAGQRLVLHRRAFAHLRRIGDLDGATSHAVGAGLQGDPEAVAVAVAAGERATRVGAAQAAVDRFATALALAGSGAPSELRCRHAEALFWAGQAAAAAAVWSEASRTVGGGRPRWRHLVDLARAEAFAGHLNRAAVLFDDVIRERSPSGPLPARLVAEWLHVVWETAGPVAASRALASVRTSALDETDAERLELAAAVFAHHAGARVSPTELVPVGWRAIGRIPAAADVESQYDLGNAVWSVCGVLGAAGCVTDASNLAVAASEQFDLVGSRWLAMPLMIIRAGLALRTGRPADVLAALGDVVDTAPGPLLGAYTGAMRASALAWLGRAPDPVSGDRFADDELPWMAAAWWHMVDGQRSAWAGDHEAASDRYLAAERVMAGVGCGLPGLVPWHAGGVDAHLTCGRTDDAERVVAELEATASSGVHDESWLGLVVASGRAGLAVAAGDRDAAEEQFELALGLPALNPLEQASVALRYGSWLRRQRAIRRARAVLRAALETARAAGAGPLAAELSRELAAAGGRPSAPGLGSTSGPTRPNAGGLSPQQWRAAELAAAGATVKEVASAMQVSPRTAEAHLGVAYRVLGVSGKVELRRRWAELDARRRSSERPGPAR